MLSLSIQDVAGNTFPQPKADIYTLSTQEVAGSAAVTLRVSQPLYFDYEIPLYREHIFEVIAHNTTGQNRRLQFTNGPTKFVEWQKLHMFILCVQNQCRINAE